MRTALSAALLLASTCGAFAEDAQTTMGISVELNTVQQVEGGCQLTFLTTSDFEQGVEQVVFETVLIDTDGAVTLLTLFDFGSLPALRPRVRQFVVPQQECTALGKILINGVAACTVTDAAPTACEEGLTLTSRTEVELIG